MPGVCNLWGREANRCLRDSRFGKSWKSWSHKTQDPMQAQSRGRQVPRPVPAHLQAVPPANHRSPGPTPGSARGIDAPGQSPFLSSVSAAQAARCHRPPQSLGGNEGSSRGRGAGSRPQTRGFSTERARRGGWAGAAGPEGALTAERGGDHPRAPQVRPSPAGRVGQDPPIGSTK